MHEERVYTLKELKKKLTEKERLFCHSYILEWNGAESAREAGYSENSARQQAFENLTKPYILQYIEFIRNNFEEEAGISKTRNLIELKKIAYSSMGDLNKSWIEREELESIKKNNPDLVDAIQEIDTKVLQKNIGSQEKPDIVDVEHVRVKLSGKREAIAEINKMMGYYAAEKHEIKGEIKQIKGITFDTE